MQNINSQIETATRKHANALAMEIAELQKNHIMTAFGLSEGSSNGSSNDSSNGASNGAVAAAAKPTKVSAKKPVTKKVGKTAKVAASAKKGGAKRTKAEIDAAKGVKRDPAILAKLQESILIYVAANCNKEDDKGNKGVNIETLSKALKAASKDSHSPDEEAHQGEEDHDDGSEAGHTLLREVSDPL